MMIFTYFRIANRKYWRRKSVTIFSFQKSHTITLNVPLEDPRFEVSLFLIEGDGR